MGAFIRKWFWFGCGAVGLGTILIVLLSSGWLGFRLFQLEWIPQGQTDLTMRAVDLPYANASDVTDKTGSLPFMAGIVIDVDGDFQDEVFLGGGRGQADGFFRYDPDQDTFVDISAEHDFVKADSDATMGGVSIDVNNDGATDLLLARESGIWLYTNDSGRLTGVRMPLEINPTSTALSIAPGDINGDGLVDLYVSGYIRNDLVEGQTIFARPYGGYSHLFLNNGDGTWADVSEDYGVWRQHNTFTAVFADLDNDADSDLVIAQDTGVVEMYENAGAPPFRPIENPSVSSYPMGIAAGDLNGDGQIDFYFSNVGHTLPTQLLRGDLPAEEPFNPLYMLFENKGGLRFEDVASAKGAGRIGFGWGTVAADMNLDGWQDLLIAQNYAKFGQPAIIHRYAGKIMQNYGGETFRPVEKRVGAENRLFAISPLVGDFNGDNLPDLVWANLQGPSKAFLNTTPDRNAITIRLDDAVATLNARITVETNGETIVRQTTAGQGLCSDQTQKIMIGLGSAAQADRVSIVFMDGTILSRENVTAGTVIDWRENQQ